MKMSHMTWYASKDGKRISLAFPPDDEEVKEAILAAYRQHGYGISTEELTWDTEDVPL